MALGLGPSCSARRAVEKETLGVSFSTASTVRQIKRLMCDTTPHGDGFTPANVGDPRTEGIISFVYEHELAERRTLQSRYPGEFCSPYHAHIHQLAAGHCAGFILDGPYVAVPRHCVTFHPWGRLRALPALTLSVSEQTTIESHEIEQCKGFDKDIAICKIKNDDETADGELDHEIGAQRESQSVVAYGHPWGLPLMMISGRIEGKYLRMDNFSYASGSAIFDASSGDWLGLLHGNEGSNHNTPECEYVNGSPCRTLPPCPRYGVRVTHIPARDIEEAWKSFKQGHGDDIGAYSEYPTNGTTPCPPRRR